MSGCAFLYVGLGQPQVLFPEGHPFCFVRQGLSPVRLAWLASKPLSLVFAVAGITGSPFLMSARQEFYSFSYLPSLRVSLLTLA